LKGDLAKAYSDKIQAYERSFVFLNLRQSDHPAVLVVFDRVVSANPALRKAWLLHGLEQPAITGNRVVFKDTRPGYAGKLTVDTILPEPSDTEISVIGGPGKEAWVDGANFPALTRSNGNNEGGGWRIEVSPKTHRATDYFLHVLQMGDHTPDSPPFAVERIETGTHVGVAFGGQVILLGKKADRSGTIVKFGVAGAGRSTVLIADLQAGAWSLERSGKAVSTVSVTAEEGVARFSAEAGDWRLRLAPSDR
jgi:heparin/heparan-sulfate lyase